MDTNLVADITFNCDKCGQNILIDRAGAGLQVQCPKCGQSLTVPSQSQQQADPIDLDDCANERISTEKKVKCFECGSLAEYEHHVVPRIRGGTKTVPLCGLCHGKAHHSNKSMSIKVLTEHALLMKRKRGEKTGGHVPYGWDVAQTDSDGKGKPTTKRKMRTRDVAQTDSDGKAVRLIVNLKEQDTIRDMADRRAAQWTFYRIAQDLNDRDILTKRGKMWTGSGVKACIDRFRREQKERAT